MFISQATTHQVQMWLKHKKIQGFYDVLQVCDCFQDDVGDFDDDSERNFNDVVFSSPEQELCRRSRCLYIAQVDKDFTTIIAI